MNPNTMQLKVKDTQDGAPNGIAVLPDELQPAAAPLVTRAKAQPTATKATRQNRRAGRTGR